MRNQCPGNDGDEHCSCFEEFGNCCWCRINHERDDAPDADTPDLFTKLSCAGILLLSAALYYGLYLLAKGLAQ